MALSNLNYSPIMNLLLIKYNQIKNNNVIIKIILNIIEFLFILLIQLIYKLYNYNYNKLYNYLIIIIYEYIIPIIYYQIKENYIRFKYIMIDVKYCLIKYYQNILFALNKKNINNNYNYFVDSSNINMNILIDLLTTSMKELKTKENKNKLEMYNNNNNNNNNNNDNCKNEMKYNENNHIQLNQEGINGHNSTNCNCEKHSYLQNNTNDHLDIKTSANYDQQAPIGYNHQDNTVSNQHIQESGLINNNNRLDTESVIEYNEENGPHDQLSDEEMSPITTDESDSVDEPTVQLIHTIQSAYDWKKLFPSSQPLIDMISEEKAFELAEALKEKRQDKTGRDAYEVDTVLVLLSQWNVIDQKSKHYAIDRANLLYLAICYGWSFALQKITPTTSAPVTTVVTPNLVSNPTITKEHTNLQRQSSQEGVYQQNNGKKMRKNFISRSYGSVHSSDSGGGGNHNHYNNYNGYFNRQNDYNNHYRRSFPPNMYYQHYNNTNTFHNKQQ